MAKRTELPELVGEFVDMSQEYLRQETLEPAKQLGRFIGFSVGAGAAFAVGVLLLSIAAMRWLLTLMPEGRNEVYWQGLGYVIAALVLGLIAALIVYLSSRDAGGES